MLGVVGGWVVDVYFNEVEMRGNDLISLVFFFI